MRMASVGPVNPGLLVDAPVAVTGTGPTGVEPLGTAFGWPATTLLFESLMRHSWFPFTPPLAKSK